MNRFSETLEEAYKRNSWIKFPVFFLRDFLTFSGRIIVACAMLSAPISFVALNTTAYMFFTMISSIIIIAYFFNFFYRPHIRCLRILPGLVETGVRISYLLNITNTGKKTLYSLRAKEFFWSVYITYESQDEIEKLLPGENVIHEVSLIPEKRGVYYSEGVRIYSDFPFNIFTWGKKSAENARMIVFPSYKRLESFDLKPARKFQPGGIALSSNVGDSTEFFGTREYVYGDNPKHIHWKSWARSGKPVIKEFQEEFFVRLAMVIDTESRDFIAFEKAVSMAAAIADYLSRFDYIIDIFAAGNNFYHFQSGRALAHFENILELLACIEPCKKIDFEQLNSNLSHHILNLSALIFIFMDWDENREQLVKDTLSRGTGVKVFVFSGKNLTKKIPEELKGMVIVNGEN